MWTQGTGTRETQDTETVPPLAANEKSQVIFSHLTFDQETFKLKKSKQILSYKEMCMCIPTTVSVCFAYLLDNKKTKLKAQEKIGDRCRSQTSRFGIRCSARNWEQRTGHQWLCCRFIQPRLGTLSLAGLAKPVCGSPQRYSDAVLPPCEASGHCMQKHSLAEPHFGLLGSVPFSHGPADLHHLPASRMLHNHSDI